MEGSQQRHASDSLIKVIEKLSKIVEQQPQRHCTILGQKRGMQLEESRGSGQVSSCKRPKRSCQNTNGNLSLPASGDSNNNNIPPLVTEVAGSPNQRRTVTCYQCSLCPYLSQTLPLLREHLKQHNEHHSDLILMCSECHFTSRDYRQLESHVRLHFDHGGHVGGGTDSLKKQDADWTGLRFEEIKSSADTLKELPQKKWYSFEEYGLYRCLICSYVCSQQRMLKTHAWKHAGLVDCSYPIFEDEDETLPKRDAAVPAAVNSTPSREEIMVLSPVLEEKNRQKLPTAFKLQLCVPVTVDNKQDVLNLQASNLSQSLKATTAEVQEEEEHAYPIKDLVSEEPAVEFQVKTETQMETEVDDSLLSSAQKIINSSPNSAGHINVIVERLPSAEDSVMTTNPLLLSQEDREKSLMGVKKEEQEFIGATKEDHSSAESQISATDIKSSKSNDSSSDENIPPASRKRTHSESLRLHSLAAEALVAMPMRTTEIPTTSSKAALKCVTTQVQTHIAAQKTSEAGTAAAFLDLELHGGDREEDLGSLAYVEGDEESPAAKAGISLSLLTVIERLRERSDQNTSDEDILKELQDNAQVHNGGIAGDGGGGLVEGLVGNADNELVDYIPGSEKPYRCRLCRYSSSNKGYIKQHLRVHKQREPYQCPICEHIASDSRDLENHMIHHCKSRIYQCKLCPHAFHYKSQLRSHEREQHSGFNDSAALTAVSETVTIVEECEQITECSTQKVFKCDVCSYTSSTYVGVRNHRRIHNSDKPYRCCSCDFATTNMNSLKSHMRKHPQEHQAVQLLEQYRCSLCGYVCSHPPSLKSHMWKHAGDQNYNYEQVNKAINEAISQSSRASQKQSAVLEPVAERLAAPHSNDRNRGPVDEPLSPASATKDPLAANRSSDFAADKPQWPAEFPTPQETDPAPLPSVFRPITTPLVPPGPGMEYCVLLFCCCICSLEFTSKERLMEHMKEHEGDIISIILSREQQAQTAE